MKKLPIALAIAAITAGSAHAVDIIYSSEDFEAGTVNYAIAGTPLVLTQLESSPGVLISTATAFTNTDYTPGSTSRMGIFANGDPIGSAGEPTGKHAFVASAASRTMTLANPMTLLDDGVQSLTVDFSYMLYGIDTTFKHSLVVNYSALGDFTDTVRIATFATNDQNGLQGTIDYTVTEDTWNSASLSITLSETVSFTDTAKLRFVKGPGSDGSQVIFLDDITITGIPAPVAAAPFAATIAPAVDPNTGYDLQWTSQTGKTYSVLSSSDLATPVDSWTVEQADIAPTPPQNSYNVPADGVRRFYVIKEIAP